MIKIVKKIVQKYKILPIQAKASIWFLICSFLQKGVSVITTPVFTRLLSTVEYGNYNIFNSWMSIISIFVSLQIYAGVYEQGLVKFDKDRNVFSSTLQGLNFILCLVWLGIYWLGRRFWNNLFSLSTVQMILMIIIIWTTGVFRFWSAEQRVQYKYKALVAITLIVSVAKPFFSIVFVILSRDKVTALILGLVLAELIGYTGLFFVQVNKGRKVFSKKYWLYAIGFALPLIPHYLAQVVLSSSDRIMIKSMVGESAAGIYSLAYMISSIMTLFNTALSQTIGPWIYQKIKDKKEYEISGITYLSLIVIAALNILVILFAPEIVACFAPKAYYEAIYVIPPVAMSVFFMFMYDFFAKFEFYYEKKYFIMIASIIGAIFNVILNYICIPIWGYYAAGYTTLICYILYVIGHYLFMKKVVRENIGNVKVYDTKKLFIISAVFIAVGFGILLTYDNIAIRYSCVAALIIIGILKKEKINAILRKIRNIKTK